MRRVYDKPIDERDKKMKLHESFSSRLDHEKVTISVNVCEETFAAKSSFGESR